MKKLLILGASLLTVLTLVNCGGGDGGQGSSSSGTSSNQSSQTSSRKPYTYKEVGTKTETSVEVKFYVNLPDDNGLYRLYHVEPGSKIDAFINLLRDYDILEICRTGAASLERGDTTIRRVTNL